MSDIPRFLRKFAADRHGATAIEYALIASMICLVIIGAVQAVGGSLIPIFVAVAAALVA